jgi:hypothetical protein
VVGLGEGIAVTLTARCSHDVSTANLQPTLTLPDRERATSAFGHTRRPMGSASPLVSLRRTTSPR